MAIRNFVRAAALIVGVALALAAVFAASVEAHGRQQRSEPADGAVLAESPPRVDMWFTQELRRAGGLPTLDVVNAAGDVVSEPAVLDDDDRTHVYAALPPTLPDGRYTVIWHGLSDEDGDESRGAFHFYVGEGPETASEIKSTPSPTATPTATPLPPPTATPLPPPTATPPPEAPDADDGLPAWLIALIGAVIGAAVTVAVVFVVSRTGR